MLSGLLQFTDQKVTVHNSAALLITELGSVIQPVPESLPLDLNEARDYGVSGWQ